jgi:hypothetical protein
MLNGKSDRGTKDGGGDYHRGDFELEGCNEGQQPDLNRIELKVGTDYVNDPGSYNRARDELWIFEKCRQDRLLPPSILSRSATVVKSAVWSPAHVQLVVAKVCRFPLSQSFVGEELFPPSLIQLWEREG